MEQSVQKNQPDILASLVIEGDLKKLTPTQKVQYYKMVCENIGLDPMSQPFKLLKMQGREILYCGREGATQLNKLHHVSHEITSRETVGGAYAVTAKAKTKDGRCTESLGAVPIANLKGEQLCNAMMKAETKAKRRATLDLLGLGMLDESEAETIQGAEVVDIQEVGAEEKPAFPTSLFISDEGLTKHLSTVKTEEELLELYNDNKARAEKNLELKQAFTARKLQIREQSQTA